MISTVSVFLFFLAAAGLVLLILCVIQLVAPFTGWTCVYPASMQQMTIHFPNAGAYSVCISRSRFWLLNSGGSLANAFPQADFFVTDVRRNEQIPFYREFGVRSTGVSKISRAFGYFDVREPGTYIVTHQNSQFLPEDEILIRKRLPAGKLVLLVLGIIAGSMLLIGGGVAGVLILVHVI